MASDADGRDALPVWLDADMAKDAAVDKWAGAEPRPISPDDLRDEVLPTLVDEDERILVHGVGGFAASVAADDSRRELRG